MRKILKTVYQRYLVDAMSAMALGLFSSLIIGLISSLVFYVGTPSQWQNLVQGLTILLALMAGILVSRGVRR